MDKLPTELVIKIFKNLRIKDAIAFSQTSKRLQGILNLPEHDLWRYYLDRDFPLVAQPINNSECKTFYQAQTFLPHIKKVSMLIAFLMQRRLSLDIPDLNIKELSYMQEKLDKHVNGFPATMAELTTLSDEAKKIISSHPINNEGDTVLIIAAERKHLDLVQTLISYGVDVNIANKYGMTPLMKCVDPEILTELIKAGTKINAVNHDGFTALNWHTCCNRKDNALALIHAGANVNIATLHGDTPLIWATSKNNMYVISALLQARANIHVTAQNGDTPLKIAERHGYSAIFTPYVQSAPPVVLWRAPVIFAPPRAVVIYGYRPTVYKPN